MRRELELRPKLCLLPLNELKAFKNPVVNRKLYFTWTIIISVSLGFYYPKTQEICFENLIALEVIPNLFIFLPIS